MNVLRYIFQHFFLFAAMFVYTAPRLNPVSGFIAVSHHAELRHHVCVRVRTERKKLNGSVPRFPRQQLRALDVWADTQLGRRRTLGEEAGGPRVLAVCGA